MDIFFYIGFFVLGLFCGSLINYVAGGLTREPRAFVFSNCRNCTEKWRPFFMLPVVGYLIARGKCRYCSKPLRLNIFLMEIGMGFLLAYLTWKYGFTWELSVSLVYITMLMIILTTDLEQMLIPNALTYPGFIIVIVISTAIMLLNVKPDWFFTFPVSGPFMLVNNYLVNSIIGGMAGFILLFILHVVSRGGMALGDVKLIALIGLMTGFPMVLLALFIAVGVGGFVAGLLLMTKRRGRKDVIPFGPFLCIGGVTALLWGKEILALYLAPFQL